MKKLLHQKQSEIFEKIVIRGGKIFLVRFVIVEREGKLRGKVISCEAVEALSGTKQASEGYLPVTLNAPAAPSDITSFDEIISPYSTLEFFMSQMTRAPAV